MHPRWPVFLMQATFASTYCTLECVHYHVHTVCTYMMCIGHMMCMYLNIDIHVSICNTSMHAFLFGFQNSMACIK